VREEREKLRPQIAATLNGRTTIDATSRHLASLSAIERSSPHWSSVITELSQVITDEAYLTAIRARGDSLIVDGLAEHASRVFDALQRSKVLIDVKSAAPVRREIQDDGTALDHFTISARVVSPQSRASEAVPAATTKPAPASRSAP
jgi:Tfp pilus assembly protein PilN